MTRSIAWILIAVMTVGPERVYALHVEAQAHAACAKAVTGALLGGTLQPGTTTTTYSYDNNGNLTERLVTPPDGDTVTDYYDYDGDNRLTFVRKDIADGNGPHTYARYDYDADGIRVATTSDMTAPAGGHFTSYLTDKNRPYAQVIEERDGTDTLLVRYTYGDDLIAQDRVIDPVADPTATARSYYHYDGQLSTRFLTNEQAAPEIPSTAAPTVTDTYTYDAFGNQLVTTGSTTNNYLYTGEQWDPNVEFYYLRARYYDQAVGRFTSRDPAPGSQYEPASLHKYVYVVNDPVNRIDPTGLWWQKLIAGILAHWYIQSRYVAERMPDLSWTESWRTVVEHFLRSGRIVDIVDVARREVYEIKPWSTYGISSGVAQLRSYFGSTGIPPGTTWPGSMRIEKFYAGWILYFLAAPGLIVYKLIGTPVATYTWEMTRGRARRPIWDTAAWRERAAPYARSIAQTIPAIAIASLVLAVTYVIGIKVATRGAYAF